MLELLGNCITSEQLNPTEVYSFNSRISRLLKENFINLNLMSNLNQNAKICLSSDYQPLVSCPETFN